MYINFEKTENGGVLIGRPWHYFGHGRATRSSVEPFICIDRHVRPQTIISRKFHQLQGLRCSNTWDRLDEKSARISRYPFVSVGWAQWQIVRKVWFITGIAPGIFVLGDVTKCDIIARSRTPMHCKPSNSVTRPLTCWNRPFYQGNCLIYH